ncbi:hypothetical protein KNO15_17695 [Leifsonia shinshuensis]|uniref:hypothetical protein n=1 Tax=Leifsonia shinshuensis TaxID=150026 RepID=UPI001F505C03|nr:hypothetical protein [Leifsonia shinshuensis]MCI0158539.1 hypothetical protein [Leifsonia shinshuensis]
MSRAITTDGGDAEGVTVSGARLPLHDAGAQSLTDRAVAAAEVVHGVDGATERLTRDAGTALTRARSDAGDSIAAAGGRLQLSFQDVETMTSEIAALSREATELAASTARIAIDGDLLASCSVSPFTGMAAEAAIGVAAAGLAQTAVRASALAVATGAVASSYAAADAWLAAAAGSLRASAEAAAALLPAGATFAGALAEQAAAASAVQLRADLGVSGASAAAIADLGVAAAAAPLLAGGAVAAVAGGFGTEALRSLGAAFAEANSAFGGAEEALNPFVTSDLVRYGSMLAAGFDRTFSLDDALAGSVGGIQAILGATGPFYDDILAGLVTAGVAVGFFRDGDVTVRPAEGVDTRNLERSVARSAEALGIDSDAFRLVDGRIIPDGWASAMAGLGQLDDLGGTERAVIRVFTVFDQEGHVVSYRVQIPSTASWDPTALANGSPGDVTSDVYSMWQGSDASLAQSVYEAMRQAGISTGPDSPPVELDGFSLGGITAAVVAADPRGFNITEIHTAGAPIGAMAVGEGVRVFSLEADEDVVAALDGRDNPRREGWLTVSGRGVRLANETAGGGMWPGSVHDVRRYAAMGADSALREVGALPIPRGGSVEVDDFYSERVR